jgi:hypothetical protein
VRPGGSTEQRRNCTAATAANVLPASRIVRPADLMTRVRTDRTLRRRGGGLISDWRVECAAPSTKHVQSAVPTLGLHLRRGVHVHWALLDGDTQQAFLIVVTPTHRRRIVVLPQRWLRKLPTRAGLPAGFSDRAMMATHQRSEQVGI